MTPLEYFNSQSEFNKWLKMLSLHESAHIIAMLEEYAAMKIEEFQNQVYIP